MDLKFKVRLWVVRPMMRAIAEAETERAGAPTGGRLTIDEHDDWGVELETKRGSTLAITFRTRPRDTAGIGERTNAVARIVGIPVATSPQSEAGRLHVHLEELVAQCRQHGAATLKAGATGDGRLKVTTEALDRSVTYTSRRYGWRPTDRQRRDPRAGSKLIDIDTGSLAEAVERTTALAAAATPGTGHRRPDTVIAVTAGEPHAWVEAASADRGRAAVRWRVDAAGERPARRSARVVVPARIAGLYRHLASVGYATGGPTAGPPAKIRENGIEAMLELNGAGAERRRFEAAWTPAEDDGAERATGPWLDPDDPGVETIEVDEGTLWAMSHVATIADQAEGRGGLPGVVDWRNGRFEAMTNAKITTSIAKKATERSAGSINIPAELAISLGPPLWNGATIAWSPSRERIAFIDGPRGRHIELDATSIRRA